MKCFRVDRKLQVDNCLFSLFTNFSFIDNVMHLCLWLHCNRRTINSMMMMMMVMTMMITWYKACVLYVVAETWSTTLSDITKLELPVLGHALVVKKTWWCDLSFRHSPVWQTDRQTDRIAVMSCARLKQQNSDETNCRNRETHSDER